MVIGYRLLVIASAENRQLQQHITFGEPVESQVGLILFCIIDFGKILYTRINLESKIDKVIVLYEEEKTYEEIQKIINIE